MVPDSLILPCVNSRICLMGKLLFTGNVRSLFFPIVSKQDLFTDLWGVNEIHLLPFMSKQDAFLFILPGKLSVTCETHVGLAGRDFSKDFVCSLTHSHNEATSCRFFYCIVLLSLLQSCGQFCTNARTSLNFCPCNGLVSMSAHILSVGQNLTSILPAS